VELILPPSHPKQAELINAFDARKDPEHPELGAIYHEDYPGFADLPRYYPDLRFIAGACGSKFGKTYGCSIRVAKEAWDNPGSLNWWVAPSYKQAEIAFRLVKRLLPKSMYNPRPSDLRIEVLDPDGNHYSDIEFKSADNDDNLRGFAVNFFVLDEAARISRAAYDSVMTTTTQTDGRGIIISTPKGRGWFFDEYQKGEKSHLLEGTEDDYPEWLSIRMPTWANPTVKAARIMTLKKNMPSDVFEQEIAARFLLESAGVFRGVRNCIKDGLVDAQGKPLWENPIEGHRYVMGVDLARKRDYSVIMVFDTKRKHLVYYDRFNALEWSIQKARIVQVAKRYKARVVIDSTGLGDPICQDIKNAGVNVEPFIFTSRSKQEVVEKLRVSLEFGHISFPKLPVVVRELENYEYKINSNGNISYSSPSGQHDDTVMAMCLANWGMSQAPLIYRARQVRGL
jgi:phage terminase large subunit-like protein